MKVVIVVSNQNSIASTKGENPNIISRQPNQYYDSTTTEAYKKIIENKNDEVRLGGNLKQSKDNVYKSSVSVYTPYDGQYHTYWTSMSIDVNVTDFLQTCELTAPYSPDLMEYWTPITAYCRVYGRNKGEEKLLFIGRVRELYQSGYEFRMVLQSATWKLKQNATTSFVEDNVKGKDGYVIIKLILEALKFDSYYISPNAEKILRTVGIDENGELVKAGETVEEAPDLLEYLKTSDPMGSITKDTLSNKLKESKVGNEENINYTLKYEEPTEVMKQIAATSVPVQTANPVSGGGGAGGGVGGGGGGGVGGGGGSSKSPAKKKQTKDQQFNAKCHATSKSIQLVLRLAYSSIKEKKNVDASVGVKLSNYRRLQAQNNKKHATNYWTKDGLTNCVNWLKGYARDQKVRFTGI